MVIRGPQPDHHSSIPSVRPPDARRWERLNMCTDDEVRHDRVPCGVVGAGLRRRHRGLLGVPFSLCQLPDGRETSLKFTVLDKVGADLAEYLSQRRSGHGR